MGPRIVDWKQGWAAPSNHQGILSPSLPRSKEERMIERAHGIDRHKLFSTISVLDRQGEEVEFIGACRELGNRWKV